MYVCVCMYVWMDGWMDGWTDGRMDGWMDGCMHACMHACMYGPVSRVPESVSLGDHTIGGGPGIRSPDSYIYIYGHHFPNQYFLIFIHTQSHPYNEIV